MKDRFVIKRFLNIVLMCLVTFSYTAAVCLYGGVWPDEAIIFIVITAMFYVLFIFFLEHKRKQGELFDDKETDYGRVTAGFAIAAFFMLIGLFLPEFTRPVLLAAICLVSLSSVDIALCVNIFFSAILCTAFHAASYEFILYCIMAVFGCIIALALEEESRYKFWYNMLVLCISVLLPGMFYYLTYQAVEPKLFLYGAIEGFLIDYLILLAYKKVVSFRKRELENKYRRILDESYPLARELEGFSKAEFVHARRVSEVASRCAKLVGADERVCAAAGFYYRIGVIEGDAIAQSGAWIVRRECFPEDVARIISEYNGEVEPLSTSESAIVHMVDALIKKLEALQSRENMSSDWNQDMVIYQTLNEFSTSGIYDMSGLSMNRFLQIREYLVKAEKLL